MKHLKLVVAATTAGEIGSKGTIPWRIPHDMTRFRQVTTTSRPGTMNAVVMGRKTFLSIPAKFRPLPNRLNIVLTRSSDLEVESRTNAPAVVARSLDEALACAEAHAVDQIFVIGGASVYEEAMRFPGCTHELLLTHVLGSFGDCDTRIDIPAHRYAVTDSSALLAQNGVSFRFLSLHPVDSPLLPPLLHEPQTYAAYLAAGSAKADAGVGVSAVAGTGAGVERAATPSAVTSVDASSLPSIADSCTPPRHAKVPRRTVPPFAPRSTHEEYQYLSLVHEILAHGVEKGDRTGTGTLSVFGRQMRFSLRDNVLPLLTTKRVFWRGVAEELLWFVRGCTNAKVLAERGIHIWDGNGSREFLDKLGLSHREEGDLGPVYGFQWRHFGAEYRTMHDDYTGQGIDQLAEVIHKIKTKPTDRRIVLTAWNPSDIPKMALPPCHMFAQFYVADGELSCQMYQRSADMGLGVPFNIASYALLTRMIAHVTGLKAGDFVHVIGDAHVYTNHVDPLLQQLEREPLPFPTLRFAREVTNIDDFTMEDFVLENYRCHKRIAMAMAV